METVRERATESEAATNRIIAATDRQDRVIEQLVECVEELQTEE